jgi:hypothetical protein
VGMHVRDVMLPGDDQRGDRYLAQAWQGVRRKRPLQVFFGLQVVRVRRERGP